MSRTGDKRRVAQLVQQIVNRGYRADLAEFLFQDPLDVFAAERADPIRLGRSGINSLLETLLLFLRQQRRLAATRLIP